MDIKKHSITIPALPGSVNHSSPSARGEWEPGKSQYPREGHCYFDIKITDPHDSIEKVNFLLNDMLLPSEKKSGEWDVSSWFTEKNPFPHFLCPLITDLVEIKFKKTARGGGVLLEWKNLILPYNYDEKIAKMLEGENLFQYPSFVLVFYEGLAGMVECSRTPLYKAPPGTVPSVSFMEELEKDEPNYGRRIFGRPLT